MVGSRNQGRWEFVGERMTESTADAAEGIRPTSPRSAAQAVAAHTFGQVAAARGSKWAEASMAALHKKERAQAVQILQLRQELERVKAQLETSQRERSDLAGRLRQRPTVEVPAAQPESGLLPKISQRLSHSRGSSVDGSGSGDGSMSRGGSASRMRRERHTSGELAVPKAPAPPPPRGAAAAPRPAERSPSPPRADGSSTASEGDSLLHARVRELEEALATERVSSKSLQSQVDHARGEVARINGRFEARLNTSTSLQHSLEARISEQQAELDAARSQVDELEGQLLSARQEGAHRARTPPEVHSLRNENAKLRQEVAALRNNLEAVGGRIKTLSGQADATSAEERSFLRMLSTMKKEQSELEHEDGELEAGLQGAKSVAYSAHGRDGKDESLQAMRRVRSLAQPTTGPGRRQKQPPSAQEQPPPPPPPQPRSVAQLAQPAPQPGRHGASESALGAPVHNALHKVPKLKLPPPPVEEAKLVTKVAEHPKPGETDKGSPRKAQAARRPPGQREVMAQLDPEAAERRSQIDLLRQRMKGLS